ncbi:hypothetical protein [Natronobiforma cellulositropha]|uniref:hypothetical protein n=1 Tax=Natronobiforma cellulositropha TaxID=1679076 RepID=UPI0021D59ED1|nr:hypothetical protein [Natronobiforma cellulositropha]
MVTTTLRALAACCFAAAAFVFAASTNAVRSVLATRDGDVAVTGVSTAYLGVETLTTSVTEEDGVVELARITNNASEPLTLDLDVFLGFGLVEEDPFDEQLAPSASTTLSVSCEPETGAGTTTVSILIEEAVGTSTAIVDVSHSIDVQRDCSASPGPGPMDGFSLVAASDVSANTSPSGQRQTFSFALEAPIQAFSHVEIGLSDPQNSGVNYNQGFWQSDLVIESGTGSVWYPDGARLIYMIGGGDSAGDTISVSIGSFETGGPAGPFTVTFTRQDTGQQASATFDVV